mmetsp:Transcript_15201/g.37791  ORF Transcript_15201/g.37791 Transcript_15201/m.37791 type:complete len:214 (+) Transcript_15201:1046-1687(+)
MPPRQKPKRPGRAQKIPRAEPGVSNPLRPAASRDVQQSRQVRSVQTGHARHRPGAVFLRAFRKRAVRYLHREAVHRQPGGVLDAEAPEEGERGRHRVQSALWQLRRRQQGGFGRKFFRQDVRQGRAERGKQVREAPEAEPAAQGNQASDGLERTAEAVGTVAGREELHGADRGRGPGAEEGFLRTKDAGHDRLHLREQGGPVPGRAGRGVEFL